MIIAGLREHTRPLHQRVEAAVDILRRTETPEEYVALLSRLLGFYEPLERRLAAVRGLDLPGLDLGARWKTPRLLGDLTAMGLDPAGASVPRCTRIPGPHSVAAALGCLYVLEGATLGGQLIRKQVEKSLGLTGAGVEFFRSYGDDVGRRWNEFRAVADREVHTPDGRADALSAAVETFECFEAWLAPPEIRDSIVEEGEGDEDRA